MLSTHNPTSTASSNPIDPSDPMQWNKAVRLLLLSTLSAIGTIGNIFAISAIMMDNTLKKRGNIFIVNLAIADFIVSAFAIPASSITILAGIPDNINVCQFQWFSAVLCCHVSILTLSFIAVENYFRVCRPHTYERWFSNPNIIAMVGVVWTVSTTCVTLQFVLGLGPDYCRMKFTGVLVYHASVGVGLVALPILIAFIFYSRAIVLMRNKKWEPPIPQPAADGVSQESKMATMSTALKSYSLLKTNFLVFVVFLLFWLPLGIAVGIGTTRNISRRLYDNLSWLALSNSCVNSFIYALCSKPFRAAYKNLFHYCCCKTSVSFDTRRQQRVDTSRPHSDVRVHIIPGYNMCAAAGARQSKVETGKRKDVYEL